MTEFDFKIDTKSLYFGLRNDNDFGHTATVSTNLKQGNVTKPGLALIRSLPNRCSAVDYSEIAEKCLLHSKSASRITDLFFFDKIYVDGIKIKTNCSFCMFIKEETDPKKYQFGRLKLHYPMSLSCEEHGVVINNREIFEAISNYLGKYAFLIRSFGFLEDFGAINFVTSIVGQWGIPYSKVFVDQKGGSSKFFKRFSKLPDAYDMEILALKHSPKYAAVVNHENYEEIATELQNKAVSLVATDLRNNLGYTNILPIVLEYPFSLYDIEYYSGSAKKYIIVKSTSTELCSFYLSNIEYSFLAAHQESAKLILVQKICFDSPILRELSFSEISTFQREIITTRFSRG